MREFDILIFAKNKDSERRRFSFHFRLSVFLCVSLWLRGGII